jgi:hypothetical protein
MLVRDFFCLVTPKTSKNHWFPYKLDDLWVQRGSGFPHSQVRQEMERELEHLLKQKDDQVVGLTVRPIAS